MVSQWSVNHLDSFLVCIYITSTSCCDFTYIWPYLTYINSSQIHGMGSNSLQTHPQPSAGSRAPSTKASSHHSTGSRSPLQMDVKHISTESIAEKEKPQPVYVSISVWQTTAAATQNLPGTQDLAGSQNLPHFCYLQACSRSAALHLRLWENVNIFQVSLTFRRLKTAILLLYAMCVNLFFIFFYSLINSLDKFKNLSTMCLGRLLWYFFLNDLNIVLNLLYNN